MDGVGQSIVVCIVFCKSLFVFLFLFAIILSVIFVCLYNYEFWLPLCKIVRSSVILLLPLFTSLEYPFIISMIVSVQIYMHLKPISLYFISLFGTVSFLLCLPFERRETYCFSLIFFLPLPLLLLLLSEACPDHNFFVFPDRSIIFGMWVHDHKVVCRIP